MEYETVMHWDIDRLRLLVQSLIGIAVIGGATYLAHSHIIDSGAVTVVYGTALGAVGAGAVGGVRTGQPPDHVHPTNGNGTRDTTGTQEKP